MNYSHPEYLISTQKLNELINSSNDNLRIFDATVHLIPSERGYDIVSGLNDFNKSHIPDASFLDLLNDFSDTDSIYKFMLPPIEQLQAAYRNAGINNDSQIIIYSNGHMMWATRTWWMLHSCGHKNVAVLDGNFSKWTHENRPVTKAKTTYPKGNFTVSFNYDCWTNKTQTFDAITDDQICTINALSPEVYSGESAMSYGRKGHIQNSKNVYYDELLNQGCFKSANDIKQAFTAKQVLQSPKTIAYCGGGISATIDAFALKLIGYENIAVYDGSMGEWAHDEKLTLITGSE